MDGAGGGTGSSNDSIIIEEFVTSEVDGTDDATVVTSVVEINVEGSVAVVDTPTVPEVSVVVTDGALVIVVVRLVDASVDSESVLEGIESDEDG